METTEDIVHIISNYPSEPKRDIYGDHTKEIKLQPTPPEEPYDPLEKTIRPGRSRLLAPIGLIPRQRDPKVRN